MALRCGGFSTAASHCTAPGIGKPESSNRAVRPGLPRRPLDGVVAVAAFVLIRTELAVGSVASANILHHDRVSVLDRMPKRGVLLQRRFFAVRRAVDQHRETRPRRAAAARQRAALRRRAWAPRRPSRLTKSWPKREACWAEARRLIPQSSGRRILHFMGRRSLAV